MLRTASALLILALLLTTACIGISRFGLVEQTLQSEIGVLSYDEAVARWGQPNSVSHDKAMFTAYWSKERSYGWVTDRLWLTFDNEKKLLRAYRYTSKPFE